MFYNKKMLFCKKIGRKGFELQTHFSHVQGCNFIGCDIQSEVIVVCCILSMSY